MLLTGKNPQQLINADSYRWHWQSEVTLSPKLEWILSKMLSPYPSDRSGKIQLVKMQPGSNKFGYEFLPINP